MTIHEAVQSVANSETITGFTANSVIKDNKRMSEFCNMINDQYHRDGNKENLESNYGKEVIETILIYGEATGLIKKEDIK